MNLAYCIGAEEKCGGGHLSSLSQDFSSSSGSMPLVFLSFVFQVFYCEYQENNKNGVRIGCVGGWKKKRRRRSRQANRSPHPPTNFLTFGLDKARLGQSCVPYKLKPDVENLDCNLFCSLREAAWYSEEEDEEIHLSYLLYQSWLNRKFSASLPKRTRKAHPPHRIFVDILSVFGDNQEKKKNLRSLWRQAACTGP